MPDAVNSNDFCVVVDFVENAIDAYSDSPIVFPANQFPAAARPRLFRELPNRSKHSRMKRAGESIQVLLSLSLEKNAMHVSSIFVRSNIPRAADTEAYPLVRA
jgi:hypothetical protein